MDPDTFENGTPIKVFDLQPLLQKIIELADVGTLVLILMVFLLITLLTAERIRSSSVIKLYMQQSIQIVTVLTSVKGALDASYKAMESNERAVTAIAENLHEVRIKLDLIMQRTRQTPRRRASSAKRKAPKKEGDA